MFIFVQKNTNLILNYDIFPRYTKDQIFSRDGSIIPILSDEYDIIEVPDQNLYDFSYGKYVYVDEEIRYINYNIETEDKWSKIRIMRDTLLPESDSLSGIMWPDYWTQKSEQYQTDWLTYRQKLRDITVDFANPDDVVWPTMPTEHADSPT